MKITKISDALKGTDVLEGTIIKRGRQEDEWIFLAPRSPWCSTAALLRNKNSLNLEIISRVSNLVN